MVNDPLMEEERERERQQSQIKKEAEPVEKQEPSKDSADQPPSFNPFDPIGSIKEAANEDQGSIFITDDDEGPEEIYTVKYGKRDEPPPTAFSDEEERSSAEAYLPPDKVPQKQIEEKIENYKEELETFEGDVGGYEQQAEMYNQNLDDYTQSSNEFNETGMKQFQEIETITQNYENDINKFNKELAEYEALTEDENDLIFERLNSEFLRLEEQRELIETLRDQYKTFYETNKKFIDLQKSTVENQEKLLLQRKERLEAEGLELQQESNQIDFQIENIDPTRITIEGQGDIYNRDAPYNAYEDIFGGGSPDTELIDDKPPSEEISGFSPDLPNVEFNDDEYEDIFGGGSPDTELIEAEGVEFTGSSADTELITELQVPQRGDPEPELPLFGASDQQRYLWEQWAKNNLGEEGADLNISLRGTLPIGSAASAGGGALDVTGIDAVDLLTGATYYNEQKEKAQYLPKYQIDEDGNWFETLAEGSSPDTELIEAQETIKPNGNIYRFDKFTGQPLVQNDAGEWITLGDAREELNSTILKYFSPPPLGGGAPTEAIENFPFGDVLLADRDAYDRFIQQMLDDSVETVKVENYQRDQNGNPIVVDVWEEEKPVLSADDKAKIAALYFGGGAVRFVDAALTIGFPLQFVPFLGKLPKRGIRAVRNNLDEWRDDYYRGQLGLNPPKGGIDDFLNSAESGFIDDLKPLPVEREADLIINKPSGGSATPMPQSPVFMADDLIVTTDPLTGKPNIKTKSGVALEEIRGNVAVMVPESPTTPSTFAAPDINPQSVDEGVGGIAQLFDEYSAATPSRPIPPKPVKPMAEPVKDPEISPKVVPPSFDLFDSEDQEAEEYLQRTEEMEGEADPFGTWVDPVPPTLESPEIQVDLLQIPESPPKPRIKPSPPDISPIPQTEPSPLFDDDIITSPETPTQPKTPAAPSPSEIPTQAPNITPSESPAPTTSPIENPVPKPPAAPKVPESPETIQVRAEAPAPTTTPTPTLTPEPVPQPQPAPPPKSPLPTKVDLDLAQKPNLNEPPPLGDLPALPNKPKKKVVPPLGSTVTLDDKRKVENQDVTQWPSVIQWKQLDDTYATLDLDTGIKEVYSEPTGTGVNQGYLDESLKIIERQRQRPKFQKTEIGGLEVTVKGPNVVDINRKLGNINESISRRVRFKR